MLISAGPTTGFGILVAAGVARATVIVGCTAGFGAAAG